MNQKKTESVIQPQELQRRIATGVAACLIDVRSPAEYASVHVPGAKLMPLDTLDASAVRREQKDDASAIYVLCQSGGRARRAITRLETAGVPGCVLVDGGTQAWIDAGLPVNRGASRVLPIMRQVQITIGIVSAAGAVLALTVNPLFALLPLVTGGGLLVAGLTGFCGLAVLLAKMPWNQATGCAAARGQTESK
jgi:rhodanese-related sulfurtransferase